MNPTLTLLVLSLMATLVFAGMAMGQETEIENEPAAQEVAQTSAAEAITLVVDNRSWSDMRIYAVRNGIRQRLGTAYTFRPAEFEVPRHLQADVFGLEVVAIPIGGGGSHFSGNVLINRGESMIWTLENRPSFSSVLLGH